MSQTVIKAILLSFSLALLCGCQALFNPFHSDFQCPETDKGKCISVTGAYEEAVRASGDNGYRSPLILEPPPEDTNTRRNAPAGGKVVVASLTTMTPSERTYQDATYDKLTRLIKKPVAPVVAPPDVVRVLILPYKGSSGDELFMPHYDYFMASSPKFIVGDYLVDKEEQ